MSKDNLNKGAEKLFAALSAKYREELKQICRTSQMIGVALHDWYTPDLIKSFATFDDFLEDINSLCEEGGTGKLLFIKEVEAIYF